MQKKWYSTYHYKITIRYSTSLISETSSFSTGFASSPILIATYV